jgi:hypothetical protein
VSSSSGSRAGDSLAGFKRRIYTVILSGGIAGSASARTANELAGTISPATRGAFCVVILPAAVAIW